jgi:hypothetical protein
MSSSQEQASADSPDQVLARIGDLTLGENRLKINNVTVKNLRSAWRVIEALEPREKAEAITALNMQMIGIKDGMDETILNWHQMTKDGSALGIEGEELERYTRDNLGFAGVAKEIEDKVKDRNKRVSKLASMLSTLGSQRAEAFSEFITSSGTPSARIGKNAISELNPYLATHKTNAVHMRELIRILNMFTLQRNRSKPEYAKEPLTPGDVKQARNLIQEARKNASVLQIDELRKEELVGARMTFEKSGILVWGKYEGELFPVFPDESSFEPVMISENRAEAGSGEGELVEKEQVEEEQAEEEQPSTKTRKAKKRTRTLPEDASDKEVDDAADTAGQERVEKEVAEEELVEEESPKKKRKGSAGQRLALSGDGILRTNPCKCKMKAEWKEGVEKWDEQDFKAHCAILGAVAEIAHYRDSPCFSVPCDWHYEKLCGHLQIFQEESKELALTISKIYHLVKNRKSFRLAWIDPSTRGYFLEAPEIYSYQKAKIVKDRFVSQLVPVPSLPDSHPPPFDYGKLNVQVSTGFFQWFKNLGIVDQLVSEVEMLRWHTRRDTVRKVGALPNSYYTLAAQLIWADPFVWYIHHEQLPTRPTFLMAYPLAVRYYDEGDVSEAFCMRDPSVFGNANSLCGEMLLDGPENEISYMGTRGGARLDNITSKAIGEDERFWDARDDSEKSAQIDESYSKISKKERWGCIPVLGQGDMHISLAGTLTKHGFEDLPRPWISVPFTYVAVNDEGVCENSIPYHELKEAHISRTTPKIGRFQSTAGHESYPGSVSLENVGPIFDMVRGLKKPSDPAVRN